MSSRTHIFADFGVGVGCGSSVWVFRVTGYSLPSLPTLLVESASLEVITVITSARTLATRLLLAVFADPLGWLGVVAGARILHLPPHLCYEWIADSNMLRDYSITRTCICIGCC